MKRRPNAFVAARRHAVILAVCALPTLMLAACGEHSSSTTSTEKTPSSLTLMAYDGFTPQDGIFDSYTRDTGITVKVVTAGDTGTMVSKALLTAGNPEADVMWGVDNTFISRAENGKLFDSYQQVDYGDVCVNYDKTWFASHSIAPPTGFEDLVKPTYSGLLVVENPATSSPGLAFLLATIAHFGDDGWKSFWSELRQNKVKVVDDWTTAYTVEFSGSSGKGKYPLVVSYGSSPPAEVVYSDPHVDVPPTAVMENTCFRQIEYAGVLRGTKYPSASASLVEFLTSRTFQESMPLTLFVFPVNKEAVLPEVFAKWAIAPAEPLTLPPRTIADKREEWTTTWTDIVLH